MSNKIVLATIHQPSIEVFYLFDLLLLLSNGRCCYNAPIRQLEEFFTSMPEKTNPADVIIFEVQRRPGPWAEKWENSDINLFRKGNSDKLAVWNEYDAFDEELKSKKRPLWLEYKLLLVRELKVRILFSANSQFHRVVFLRPWSATSA